jgi:hypothetical protein
VEGQGSPFPSPSKHVIREITRDSSREVKSRRSVTSQNSSVVDRDPKNHNLLRRASTHRDLARVFQECSADGGQKGVFGEELIQCVGITDLVETTFDGVDAAIADGGTSKENKAITESVLEPISEILTVVLGTALDVGGFAFDLCLGDFTAEEIVEEEIALCDGLPLKAETEWSVIAVNIDLPAGPAATVCPGLNSLAQLRTFFCSTSTATTGLATAGVGSLVGSAQRRGPRIYCCWVFANQCI